ncbi:protein chibby homolog 1-like [Dendronephthya gigantea]|uniref:protein chibby homolog 1-like n=1 Tax=Dendronephthya gigantea TaxID=151771 RepID=UPI001069ECFF|nr:protein chibby homolog 1-like [Dendronephthya gigantea]
MPLFKRKGKVPPRNIEAGASTIKTKDLDDTDRESGIIKLNLGDNKLVFEDGVWTSESTGVGGGRSSGAEVRKLKEQNLQLKEENNLLQYKIEILLDMLAANKADLMVLEEEVEVLTKQKSTRVQ